MFSRLIHYLFTHCKKATFLMDKEYETTLSGREKLLLKFHLLICDGCRRYEKQSLFLNNVLKKHASAFKPDTNLKLSENSRSRIELSIQEKIRNS